MIALSVFLPVLTVAILPRPQLCGIRRRMQSTKR